MKNFTFHFKNSAILLVMLTSAFAITSCSNKLVFATSSIVPAAEGSVNVSKDDNSNYNIELKVIRLADPSRLQPKKSVYVVWMESDGNGVKNLGQLKSEEGFFTNNLKATLKTVSPTKPKRIFITAEDEANIQQPGSQTILTTK